MTAHAPSEWRGNAGDPERNLATTMNLYGAAAQVRRDADREGRRAPRHYVLLAFLELGDGQGSADSRSQVQALRSILRQYRTASLKLVAVAVQRPGLQDRHLIDVARDWSVGDIPLLPDKAVIPQPVMTS
jgi:hypothetical protein